jgi:ATP-binding cassette subfamily F protein 3
MPKQDTIIRFEDVFFGYGANHPILSGVNFSVRRGSKITLMGQNGAGKSTIFSLLSGAAKPDSGSIHISDRATKAIARQVIPRDELDLSVREFFAKCFKEKVYDIDPKIDAVCEVVHLKAPHDRAVKGFSGGEQARLLLASALIQNPDILLLDEPTNNLDRQGIEHLTQFLKEYTKTCIVISHDADFLNTFTDGVLYLDVHMQTVEQYVGNYFDVIAQITSRIERENMKNAQLGKKIQENKDKANFFANKGGRMRALAKKMREEAEELEEEKVDVRREDKTIRPFAIPTQADLSGEIVHVSSFTTMRDHKPVVKKASISLKKGEHLLLAGPNGIGKSTFLESLASGSARGASIAPGVVVGYYRQDFSTLNFDDTVYASLGSVMSKLVEEKLRATAAQFLITGQFIHKKIGNLSEGQKGLVAFARLVLQQPGLLILDEPTNHINFRHIPVIAAALDKYEGAMVLVSHVPEFVKQIRIDEVLDLNVAK